MMPPARSLFRFLASSNADNFPLALWLTSTPARAAQDTSVAARPARCASAFLSVRKAGLFLITSHCILCACASVQVTIRCACACALSVHAYVQREKGAQDSKRRPRSMSF